MATIHYGRTSATLARLPEARLAPARARAYARWPRVLAVGGLFASTLILLAMLGLSSGALTSAHAARNLRAARARDITAPVHGVRSGVASTRAASAGVVADPRLGASPPSTLPFPPNRADRAPRPGEVPSLYDDGLSCSTGCRPYGAQVGWPLAPFHVQHPIRAALNELRPASLHVGLDIQAADGARVYAVQPGYARVLEASGPNARVQVGNYLYWHINPAVTSGQYVTPFVTVLGTVMAGYGHIAFSELNAAGDYVNPLRPGGSVLEPYTDRAAPEVGAPALAADGQVVVSAYSPQSFVTRTSYVTPVLGLAGLAYRLYDAHGTAVTSLQWAMRGTQLQPWAERSLIYAPSAHAPGYGCFATHQVCVPQWNYRLAGGLAPPLPSGLPAGPYRLTVYAWNWADHVTALDTPVTLTASGWRPLGHFPPAVFALSDYSTRSRLLPPVTPVPLWRRAAAATTSGSTSASTRPSPAPTPPSTGTAPPGEQPGAGGG